MELKLISLLYKNVSKNLVKFLYLELLFMGNNVSVL